MAVLPFQVVAVMVTLPFFLAVTTPLLLTVAILVLEDFQVSFCGSAVNGAQFLTAKVTFLPTLSEVEVLFKVKVETGTLPTVIVNFFDLVPTLTVMMALPADTAVMTPALSTVATFGLLEENFGTSPVAFFGLLVTLIWYVWKIPMTLDEAGVVLNDFNLVALATT